MHDYKFAQNAKQLLQPKDLSTLFKQILDPVKFRQFYDTVYA